MMLGIANLRISRFIIFQSKDRKRFKENSGNLAFVLQPKHLTSLSFWSILRQNDG
jgi:hypothetical protein